MKKKPKGYKRLRTKTIKTRQTTTQQKITKGLEGLGMEEEVEGEYSKCIGCCDQYRGDECHAPYDPSYAENNQVLCPLDQTYY